VSAVSTPTDWHAAALTAGGECLAAALDYVARGWPAIPCCPPDHMGVGRNHAAECKTHGKFPLVSWKEFQTRLPTPDEVRGWWRRWPQANVWCAMGPVSGLVRLDVDAGQGEEFLAELSRGDVPETLEMLTSAGRGLFYAIPDGFTPRITHNHGDKVHEGLSLLGQGAGTVMPPSRHKSGRRYSWKPDHSPDDLEPAPMPAWLMEQMRSRTKAVRASAGAKPAGGGRVTEGGRNNRLTSLAGSMRRVGAEYDVILAALAAENAMKFDPPLEDSEVDKVARSVCGYDPEPQAVIKSAASKGWEIIANDFRRRYKPAFRVGDAIYSSSELREVRRLEACAELPPSLIEPLRLAADFPTGSDGKPKGPDAAPAFFRKWSPTAFNAVRAELPDEDSAELGTAGTELAREEFARLVREALLMPYVCGQNTLIGQGSEAHYETKLEKRPLAAWCERFAKPTWADIQGLKLWTKAVDRGDERIVRIAIRHEVFAQIKADRRLCEMGGTKFTTRCERYGIGKPGGQAERPHGKWAIVLDDAFVADLLGTVDVDAEHEG
jgi:hypothetical protein